MMSLEGGKIQCVALLYGPRKAGRGAIQSDTLFATKIITRKIRKQVYFNIDFLQFYSFFSLSFFYILWKPPALIS